VKEYCKKSELSLLHSNHVLAHTLSIAGVSDNILQLSILKEEHWERKKSNQNCGIFSGSF